MLSLSLIFIVIAMVLFALAAVGVPAPPRFNLTAAGLFFFAASFIVTRV